MAWTVTSRRRRLDRDGGARVWQIVDTPVELRPARTAVVLCDVWDRHWCPTAERRLEAMVPQMNALVDSLRDRGALIVHAPSETMEHYAEHPARARALDQSRPGPDLEPPVPIALPALPVAVGPAQGCDAAVDVRPYPAWSRQHPGISVDGTQDLIADEGPVLARIFRSRGVSTVLLLGVHTNMCILNRSFGIKALVGYGFAPLLVRDLTDAMYDPADAPYVDHDEGTALIVEYIEKYLCGTVTAAGLTRP